MPPLDSNNIREFRVYRRPPNIYVQFGFFRRRAGVGKNARFTVLQEWAAKSYDDALRLKQEYELDIHLHPERYNVAVNARPILSARTFKRVLRRVPMNITAILEQGVAALWAEPLPTIEESHAKLGTRAPQQINCGARQSTLRLTDPAYQRLVAMAAAAGEHPNRIIEVMLATITELVEDHVTPRPRAASSEIKSGRLAQPHTA